MAPRRLTSLSKRKCCGPSLNLRGSVPRNDCEPMPTMSVGKLRLTTISAAAATSAAERVRKLLAKGRRSAVALRCAPAAASLACATVALRSARAPTTASSKLRPEIGSWLSSCARWMRQSGVGATQCSDGTKSAGSCSIAVHARTSC
eukprot:scaffold255606_cov28-Tisochrysis_lutea.AAC.2